MLTGQRSFKRRYDSGRPRRGATTGHRLDGPASRYAAATPAAARTLPRSRRKTRLRDIGEARVAIQHWLANPTTTSNLPTSLSEPRRASRLRTASVILAGAAVMMRQRWPLSTSRERPPEARLITTSLLPPDGALFDFPATRTFPALSPDGRHVVFGARSIDGKSRQLWLRPLTRPRPNRCRVPKRDVPFWSPDGRYVGFAVRNELKKIKRLRRPAVDPRGFRRSVARRQLDTARGHRLRRHRPRSIGAGPPRRRDYAHSDRDRGPTQKRPVSLVLARWPSLPLCLTSWNCCEICSWGASTNRIKQAKSWLRWARTRCIRGHLLYVRGNTLMAQPFDVHG